MTPLAIETQGLAKEFRSGRGAVVRAVDGIDLAIEPGQIVAFLGPNGAGKTTTIDMLLGLTKPDSGSARIAGLLPRDAVQEGKVSAVLQTGGLLADLTVEETVRLIAATFQEARAVSEVMARAGITALARRKVSKCSGGEKQRLRFALALLPDPEVLILDEPTAGMDVRARHEFWATMRAETQNGRTVMFATHYLEEADSFAERIIMVARGRVVADGSTSEIRAQNSGRTISAAIPEHDGEQWVSRLRELPGVREVAVRGDRIELTAADTDEVALVMLRDMGAREFEIAPATLDSAFLALTGAPLDGNAPLDSTTPLDGSAVEATAGNRPGRDDLDDGMQEALR